MAVGQQDWVTLEEAALEAKVPTTTIRDWYRSGAIEATTTREGHRLVRRSQVHEQATGLRREAGKVASPRVIQPAGFRPDAEAVASINQTVQELQDLARERLEPEAAR
jgi:excisionase family DNA binding protein